MKGIVDSVAKSGDKIWFRKEAATLLDQILRLKMKEDKIIRYPQDDRIFNWLLKTINLKSSYFKRQKTTINSPDESLCHYFYHRHRSPHEKKGSESDAFLPQLRAGLQAENHTYDFD